nr:MAG TPA: hypothetical protein [Caudoviricetes sp.]
MAVELPKDARDAHAKRGQGGKGHRPHPWISPTPGRGGYLSRRSGPEGCASCRGEKAPGTYMTGRVPAVPGFGNVPRVDAGFGCAGTEMHTHGDRRIRFCQVCGRGL